MKPRSPCLKIITSFAIVVLVLLIIYIGSYVVLSVNGCYEPYEIGPGRVKLYGWSPYWFTTEYKWNTWLMNVYLPLWVFDQRFWHTYDEADSGKYPIHEVDSKDVWRIYQANKP
jgi:hypothetical protein